MKRTELTPGQFTNMRQVLLNREREIIDQVLQRPDYPPLPPCPRCSVPVERLESMVEPPEFQVYESALLINVEPCGHKFRSVVDPADRLAAP